LVPFGQNEDDFLGALSAFCRAHDAFLVFRVHQNAVFPEREFDRIMFCPQSDYPDTENILLDTDVLISDWSSIVFDFMVLDRPTIFIDVPHPFAKGCTLGPEYRFGYNAKDMDDLRTTLATYIHSPHRYFEEFGDRHRSVKDFVYDDYADGRASDRCLQRLRTLLS
jgi:CDP-glycerol glycerophosphotransferase